MLTFFLLCTFTISVLSTDPPPDLRVSTIAGLAPYTDNDNGERTAGTIPYAGGKYVAVASDGTLLLEMNGRIVTPQKSGLMLTLAGGGSKTLVSGLATHSKIYIRSLEAGIDESVAFYFADQNQDVIWSVTPSGYISLFAGKLEKPGLTTPGIPALEGKLNDPTDVKVAANGDVFIVNYMSNNVFKVTKSTGLFDHVAGRLLSLSETFNVLDRCHNSSVCGDGNDARLAMLNGPLSIALGPSYGTNNLQDLYIYDQFNGLIRRVNAVSGLIETIAGEYGVQDEYIDYISDINVHPISGIVFFISSSAVFAIDKLSGNYSSIKINSSIPLNDVSSFTFDKLGNMYLPDLKSGLHIVRNNNNNNNSSLIVPKKKAFSSEISGSNYALQSVINPQSICVCPNNDIVFTEWSQIKRISSTTGLVSLLAGNTTEYELLPDNSEKSLLDGILAISAIVNPNGVSCRNDGMVIFSDKFHVLRSIALNGTISTFAGTMLDPGLAGDNGPAHLSLLNNPTGITSTANDDYIYFCDSGNFAVRRISTSDWTIETIAGVLGQEAPKGGVFISGPALTTLLKHPRYLAVHGNGDVYVSDNDLSGIFKISSGITSHFAGRLGFDGPASTLPPGSALEAVFYYGGPQGITLSPSGDELFIADNSNYMIRKIDLSTSIISPVFGSASAVPASNDAGYTSDGISGSETIFAYPTDVVFSPLGELFIIDQYSSIIREAVMYGPTICPAGFFCSVGRNFAPCSNPNSTCPPNSKEPVVVDPGFMSAALPETNDTLVYGPLYSSQAPCFTNSTCFRGRVTPCPSGRFGSQGRQAHPDSCSFCNLDYYLPVAGKTVAKNGQSPCIRCPEGASSWLSTGATVCPLCQPGTYRAQDSTASGNASRSVCSPCPIGSTSLFGAATCFMLDIADSTAYTKPTFFSFQRLIPILDGNTSPGDLNIVTLKAVLPIFLAALVPYVFFVLLSKNLFSEKVHKAISNALANLDQFALKEPEEHGQAPSFLPSHAGGACSIFAFGIVVALIVSTIIQYALSNSLLQQSLLTLTPTLLDSFSSLPPAFASVSVDDKTLIGLTSVCGSSGFLITIGAMGLKCGAPLSIRHELGFGNFSRNIYSLNESTGLAFHTFCCSNCIPDVLSTFSATFDASCQSLVVSVAAVNAGGGVSVSSVHVSRDNAFGSPLIESISATFPIALEVVQDNVFGSAPRLSDNLVLGGRSVSGLVVLPQSTYSTKHYDSEVNDIGNVITITASIPIQPSYTLYLLLPVMTLLQLFSSLSAWLSLIGLGATLLFIHNKIVSNLVKDNITNLQERFQPDRETNDDATKVKRSLEFVSQNPMIKVTSSSEQLSTRQRVVGRGLRAPVKEKEVAGIRVIASDDEI